MEKSVIFDILEVIYYNKKKTERLKQSTFLIRSDYTDVQDNHHQII